MRVVVVLVGEPTLLVVGDVTEDVHLLDVDVVPQPEDGRSLLGRDRRDDSDVGHGGVTRGFSPSRDRATRRSKDP